MTRLRDIYGPGHSQADYLRALAAGHETGYWDERGTPAPLAPSPDRVARVPHHRTQAPSAQENNPSNQPTEGSTGYTTPRDLTRVAGWTKLPT